MRSVLMVIISSVFISLNLFGQIIGFSIKKQPSVELEFKTFAPYNVSISGFSMDIRDVPLHEYDEYLRYYRYATTPLPDVEMTSNTRGSAWLTVYFAFFAGAGIFVSGGSTDTGKDSEHRYQQNQWGDARRIEGASLRWYELHANNTSYFLHAQLNTGFISVITKKTHLRIRGGYIHDLSGLDLEVHAGWDRFSSDEIWKKVRIGKVYGHARFFEIDLGLFGPNRPGAAGIYVILQAGKYFSLAKIDYHEEQYVNYGSIYPVYHHIDDNQIELKRYNKWFGGLSLAYAF